MVRPGSTYEISSVKIEAQPQLEPSLRIRGSCSVLARGPYPSVWAYPPFLTRLSSKDEASDTHGETLYLNQYSSPARASHAIHNKVPIHWASALDSIQFRGKAHRREREDSARSPRIFRISYSSVMVLFNATCYRPPSDLLRQTLHINPSHLTLCTG